LNQTVSKRNGYFEIPDDMPEDKLNNFLDKAQKKAQSAIDVSYILQKISVMKLMLLKMQ
jgi:hypothetical protein